MTTSKPSEDCLRLCSKMKKELEDMGLELNTERRASPAFLSLASGLLVGRVGLKGDVMRIQSDSLTGVAAADALEHSLKSVFC